MKQQCVFQKFVLFYSSTVSRSISQKALPVYVCSIKLKCLHKVYNSTFYSISKYEFNLHVHQFEEDKATKGLFSNNRYNYDRIGLNWKKSNTDLEIPVFFVYLLIISGVHRRRQNVYISDTLSCGSCAPFFCSYHIVTPSIMYY